MEGVQVHGHPVIIADVLAVGQLRPNLRRVVLADEEHIQVVIVVAQVGCRGRAHGDTVAGITLAEARHRHRSRAVRQARAVPEIVELEGLGHTDDPQSWLWILLRRGLGILREYRGRQQCEQQNPND